ncbi:TPA: TetR/AcrR family transcriptional regulator [Vibrio cholerae]|nr:TetR/AcrR family transcriptional regulator [Vibrio cholerae]HAS5648391.1 TetR/AcrR family transcriptional regulator [Vibrio cholerae]HDV5277954.1 TetR/AcrR family transcriptional regulator [Vibrio cholerae]HDV5414623.1 TetR/AcrR family transcriptional regulator [Vibrio cholerae]HDV5589433.1 TetR/AcrR family transcriptional regulator [Vibrio cholerae]
MALRSSTKEKILDVAEGLFAEYGFNDTSLRTITSKAGGEPCVGQLPFW